MLLALLMVNPALAQEPDVPLDLYCVNFEIGAKTYDKQQDLHILQYNDWTITLDDPSSGCGNYGCTGSVINTKTQENFSKYFDCSSADNNTKICSVNRNYWNFVREKDKNLYYSPQCDGTNIVIDKKQCNECECVFMYPNSKNIFKAKCKDFDENNMTCFTYTGYEDRYLGHYSDFAERYQNCKL